VVGDLLDDRGGDRAVASIGLRGRHLDQRTVRLAPAEHVRGVELVEPERARHLPVDLEEEGHAPDQRRHVVGVRAQREVTVAVGRARGGEHERPGQTLLEQLRHLGEVVRDEVAAAVPERLARRGGQEVGHVTQPVAEGAEDVRPLVQRVHLVDAHALERLGVLLERVDQADRLAVGERQDHVGLRSDVTEDVLGTTRLRQHAGHRAQDVTITPMKRHAALQPLSRDHHVALVAAQRLCRATETDAAAARDVFLEFWREHGAHHFRVEEEVLLPAFAAHGDPNEVCVVRMLVDHVRIREQAQRLEREGSPSVESLRSLGTALERHVRLEEREVFGLIEAALPPEAAEELVEAVLRAERSP
jgi:hypothetical protein